jgi:uncharacterized membrane protein YgcG
MTRIIPIKFEIFKGAQALGPKLLEQETIKVGSQPSADIKLDDPGIAKMHAVIERTATGFQLADLAGRGGTSVNGAAVVDRRPLANGDQIQIGPFRLIVSFQQDGQAAALGGVAAGTPQRRKRRKKKPNEFERRFLSERYSGGAGVLEVAVVWRGKVIAQDAFEKSQTITVGNAANVNYRVEHTDLGESFQLLTPVGNTWELNFTHGMEGFAVVHPEHNGKVKFPLRDAISHNLARAKGKDYTIPIDGNNRVKVTIGEVTFLVHYVTRQALALAKVRTRNRNVFFMAAAVVLCIFSVGAFLVTYYPDKANEMAAAQNLADAGFLKIMAEKEKDKEEKKQEPKEDEPPPEEEVVEDKPKDVKPDKPNPGPPSDNPSKITAPSNLSPSQSKSYAKAASVGAAKSSSALKSVASLGVGSSKAEGALGGLAGFAGDAGGPAGLAMESSGALGGGGGIGSMGGGGNVGGGLDGGGGKGGGDGDYREKGGNLKEKAVGKPVLKPSEASTSGNFDKQIIKRVINQKKSEITNCYNKELMKKPDLKGRITMKWRILSSGNVGDVSVSNNEMGNSEVANCLKGRIAGWKFPAPKGGGAVDVAYPFNFDSAK